MKRFTCMAFSAVLFCTCTVVFAQVVFSGPDINAAGDVLFSVQAEVPGKGGYQTLFRQNVDTAVREQLTFFPEQITSLSGGQMVQVRNRFGTIRYNSSTNAISWLAEYQPFVTGGLIQRGRLEPLSPSPDGRWIVSLEPVTAARARLVLHDIQRGLRFVIDESVDRGSVPVKWSPDSAVLLYSVRGTIYFARPDSFFSLTRVEDRFRSIGPGGIESVDWYSSSHLLYIHETAVYRIATNELFTRALYSDLVGPGILAGKLPVRFDPSEDRFRPSPDGRAVLLAKNARAVYYFPLEGDDYVRVRDQLVQPYLLLPGNTAVVRFLWVQGSTPAVLTTAVQDGHKLFRVWMLMETDAVRQFREFTVPAGTEQFLPSPDNRFLAFLSGKSGLRVYDTSGWKEYAVFKDETVVSAAWADDQNIFVGGAETVRRWNIRTGISSVLFLSAVSTYGWDEQNVQVVADTTSLGRFMYEGGLRWSAAASRRIKPAIQANNSWRLYIDRTTGYYDNMIFARSIKPNGGTIRLVSEPPVSFDALSGTSVRDNGTGVFSAGPRSGERQVALVFDAIDCPEGLAWILYVLRQYNIRATFFINGEFIRRHPAAVNEIVKAGHQTASMFFTSWNLSGTGFRIDRDFIMRGLARNEDDFYAATGQELTLLWHAPGYVISPVILDSGEAAGYRYVFPDVPVPDWVTAEAGRSLPGLYKDASSIIDDVMTVKRPGSIIPVRIGKPAGNRTDWLYQRVDTLINALVESGYRIVTVGDLIQGASKQ